MDAYKTPESNLELGLEKPFKPIIALTYGLLVSLGLSFVASNIEMIVFLLLNRDSAPSLSNESEIKLFLAKNVVFLLLDILTSVAILYYAGTRVRKFACGQEIKYGFILSAITFSVLFAVYLFDKAYSIYPHWYSFTLFASTFLAVFLGAKPKP